MPTLTEPVGIHAGDIGTELRLTIVDEAGDAVDLSTVTTKELIFEKPDGSAFSRTLSFVTNGTDGLVKYVTVSGDIAVDGYWLLQAKFVFVSNALLRSNRLRIRVWPNTATPS